MLLDAAALQKTAEIDPSILEFAKAHPSPPLDWADYNAIRAGIGMVEQATLAQIGPAEPALSESYKEIPLSDGAQAKIKIIKPASPLSGGSPLIVLAFGGGYISGSLEQLTANARAFARLFGAVVVNLNYRLSPEHKFPTGQQDCYDSVKWIAANASDLGADPSKGFIVGGVSAGGNASAVVAMKAAESKELAHPITGQWLGIPLVLSADTVPEKYKSYYVSREQNKSAPILDGPALDALTGLGGWDQSSSMLYPHLSKTPLSSLPPAYFTICGMDPLRDDGLIYEEMLKEAGVKTKLDLYPGCPHAHWSFMPGIEPSNKTLADINIGVGWLLGKSVNVQEALGAYAAAA